MDLLRPLGKRDIFGIILPGSIVVFAGAYALFGVLSLLKLSVKDLLDQELLLSVVFFVVAYLTGNVLRLFAADDVDKESSEYLEKKWWKEHQVEIKDHFMSDYEECKAELAKGSNVADVPDEFDDWLWRVEEFPYPAWQNRKWQAHGFCEALGFFHDNYRSSMWSENRTSPKSFLNYCKLAVINGGGGLADEVSMAEGLTRFFAGTVIAFQGSIWLLAASLIVQLLLVVALTFAPRWGINLVFSVPWTFQGFHFALTVAIVFALQRIRRKVVSRFRVIRLREAETAYHAFYLYSTHHPDGAAKREQVVSRKTLKGRLKSLFTG
jgi:hypothetical protein